MLFADPVTVIALCANDIPFISTSTTRSMNVPVGGYATGLQMQPGAQQQQFGGQGQGMVGYPMQQGEIDSFPIPGSLDR